MDMLSYERMSDVLAAIKNARHELNNGRVYIEEIKESCKGADPGTSTMLASLMEDIIHAIDDAQSAMCRAAVLRASTLTQPIKE